MNLHTDPITQPPVNQGEVNTLQTAKSDGIQMIEYSNLSGLDAMI